MIQSRVGAELIERPHSAGFRIIAPIDQPWDAGVHDCPGTHRAGLERDVEGAIQQPPMAEGRAGFAHRDDLGVCGRVVIGLAPVGASPDDSAGRIVNDHATDRNFAERHGFPGQFDRDQKV